jgi:hypothetical protein
MGKMKIGRYKRSEINQTHAVKKHRAPGEKYQNNKAGLIAARIAHRLFSFNLREQE